MRTPHRLFTGAVLILPTLLADEMNSGAAPALTGRWVGLNVPSEMEVRGEKIVIYSRQSNARCRGIVKVKRVGKSNQIDEVYRQDGGLIDTLDIYGVYVIEEDVLTICYTLSGLEENRPDAIAAKKGWMIARYRRARSDE